MVEKMIQDFLKGFEAVGKVSDAVEKKIERQKKRLKLYILHLCIMFVSITAGLILLIWGLAIALSNIAPTEWVLISVGLILLYVGLLFSIKR